MSYNSTGELTLNPSNNIINFFNSANSSSGVHHFYKHVELARPRFPNFSSTELFKVNPVNNSNTSYGCISISVLAVGWQEDIYGFSKMFNFGIVSNANNTGEMLVYQGNAQIFPYTGNINGSEIVSAQVSSSTALDLKIYSAPVNPFSRSKVFYMYTYKPTNMNVYTSISVGGGKSYEIIPM